jgi:cobalt-zinc-cadmium efflux system membrane fusion protein
MKKTIILFSFSLFIFSCSSSEKREQPAEVKTETDLVVLTEQQAKTAKIKTGKAELRDLSGEIKVNGVLDVPPQNLVSISVPMGGIVKNTDLLPGMKIKKGQILAVIQNIEFIQLQQDYSDFKSQLSFLEEEYNRQKELAKENVNSQKTLSLARSQYESMLSKVNGLRAKLELLGLPVESGSKNFQSTINLYSPVDGFVSQVNANIGSFATPSDVLFKILDTEHIHAELNVYERDIHNIQVGQKVRFTLANEAKERTATVYLVGKEIQPDRTIKVHCHLDKEDNSLVPGMFIKAFIEMGTHPVKTLPSSAILNFEGKDYIFVKRLGKSDQFVMVVVSIGVEQDNFCEVIIPEKYNDSEVVTEGGYFLLSKLKNTDE